MPQMAPMWWTFIMAITLVMMLMTMTIKYFNLSNKLSLTNMFTQKKKNINWKW
uniref:ATP synthase complex subunit 8 n=1 Tax=Alobaldia tobae TaxID=2040484 RepID=A0A343KJ60_9HEMI|nr:ATP synthase F0 subunit 8 [Alobaldia tobae]